MAEINSIADKERTRTAAVLLLPEYGTWLGEVLDDAAPGRLVRQVPPNQRTPSPVGFDKPWFNSFFSISKGDLHRLLPLMLAVQNREPSIENQALRVLHQ